MFGKEEVGLSKSIPLFNYYKVIRATLSNFRAIP